MFISCIIQNDHSEASNEKQRKKNTRNIKHINTCGIINDRVWQEGTRV